MPQDFFETHGEELFVIVFRLSFYNHKCIFGDGIATTTSEWETSATLESKINYSVHLILVKFLSTPKSET